MAYWCDQLCIIGVIMYHTGNTLQQQVTLSPSPVATVVEGENLTLVCSSSTNVSGIVSRVVWGENNVILCTITMMTCSCLEADTSEQYHAICSLNYVSFTVKHFNRSRNTSLWKCTMRIDSTFVESGTTQVLVKVGITGISLLPVSTVNIIADTIGTLVCRTSGGLPAAKVTWFKEASTGRVNLTSFSTSEASMQDGLIVVTSTITLRPSKNDNSIRIYCNASNIGALHISQTSIINVLYSPDTPICTYRDSAVTSVVHVTRGSTLNITCMSTGNPPDITYIWTLPDTRTRNGFILSVVNIQPYQNGQYRVSVSNNMTPTIGTAVIGTNSVTMMVIVEYPPLSPTLKIGNITVSGTIRIIAGQSVTISCSSQSNPPPDLYYWAPGGTRNITDLELRNVQPSDYDGVYTCIVQNRLSPTGDKPFTGMSSSSVNLEVLYPPANPQIHIDNTHGIEVLGKKLGIVYGANITLACQADSNPSPTYSWPSQLWTGIVKQNITITCNVSNIMNPTVHAPVSGNIVVTITLYVIYEPEQPTLFYVINETISETSATVTWLPQFNGGMRQLFHLKYRASSIDSWTIRFFNDTSSNILKPMYAAINNLQSAMEYHVELFAINANGQSKPLSDTFKTLTKTKNDGVKSEAITGSSTGAIVGGLVAGCILTFLIATILYLRRKYALRWPLVPKENKNANTTETRPDAPTRDTETYSSIQQEIDDIGHRYSMPVPVPEQQAKSTNPYDETLHFQKSSKYANMLVGEGNIHIDQPFRNSSDENSYGNIMNETVSSGIQSGEEYEMIQPTSH